jgi:hypothetical protein
VDRAETSVTKQLAPELARTAVAQFYSLVA